MNNIAYTYEPKWDDPFTGEKNVGRYLVPALDKQRGKNINYIVVTCSPSMNGVYSYPAENVKNYTTWDNYGRTCLYVPISDCEYTSFEDIGNEEIIKQVKKMQKKKYQNMIKNRDYTYKKGKPDWML